MSVVKLKGKRAALRKVNHIQLAEAMKALEPEKVEDDSRVVDLLNKLLAKEMPKPDPSKDYSEHFAGIASKLDAIAILASKEEPQHSNEDVVEALGRVEAVLRKLQPPKTAEKEPMITGFTIAKRDLLGRVKDVEFIRNA